MFRHGPSAMIARTAEDRFLLSRVRAACGFDTRCSAADELHAIDWEHLERLAVRHRLVPLLHRGMQLDGTAAARLDRECIARRARRIARFNLRRSVEVVGLTMTFEGAGVPPVWFRGPVLAQILYGTPSLRHFVDLDFLVPADAVALACDILEERGYVLRKPDGIPEGARTRHQRSAVVRHIAHHHFAFQHESHHGKLELHWRFAPRTSAWDAAEPVLARGVTVPFASGSVRTLGREDQLLQLSLHGSEHLWSRLGWLVDLARHIQLFSASLDWDEVWERAVRAHCRRKLLWGLYLADRIFGAPLPDVMRQRVREAESRLESVSRVVKLEEVEKRPSPVSSLTRPLRWEMEPRAKLRYWVDLLSAPRPSVLLLASLPPRWFAAYRIMWPIWGLMRVLGRLWRRVRATFHRHR